MTFHLATYVCARCGRVDDASVIATTRGRLACIDGCRKPHPFGQPYLYAKDADGNWYLKPYDEGMNP